MISAIFKIATEKLLCVLPRSSTRAKTIFGLVSCATPKPRKESRNRLRQSRKVDPQPKKEPKYKILLGTDAVF